MKYLNEKLVKESFLRLRQSEAGGKKGLERTSGLMIFLAFDAVLKLTSSAPPLDLDPDNFTGDYNRDALTTQFACLLHLKNSAQGPVHVINLGQITFGPPSPESRFSANFLTVPVKKATTSNEPFEYPNRPKPLLLLGQVATHVTWGIAPHPDWRQNLPAFLEGRRTRTPFHDLACFILRQKPLSRTTGSFQDALISGLEPIFTAELCKFWGSRLSLEKIYWPTSSALYQDTPPNPFGDHSWVGGTGDDDAVAQLQARIGYLEGLLQMHDIPFDKDTLL